MAAVYSYHLLSASTGGRAIPVAATATPGTLIHTANNLGVNSFDQVFLTVDNVTALPVALTIEWGGTTAPGDLAPAALSIPANTSVVVKTGQPLNSGLVVRAFAETANALNITGNVLRITG